MTDFLIAYWLHSTVLLASMWCLRKVARPRSPVVRERLWKLAAVLPVLTAMTSVGFRSAKAVPFAERKATIRLLHVHSGYFVRKGSDETTACIKSCSR